eukprot:TRINITY_DN10696_c0_g1_i1.p1 TRINITY_DN10696_c0_g1~~TRINITY_DN10696_c0_g1_i1.p1  ORF type:complete len:114 (-),score=43.93 TRINITY_DN10696_c0_g1_i1:4-345(-)
MAENRSELAVTYATLILHDEGLPIEEDKIKALVEASGVEDVEPYWAKLFSKVLGNKTSDELDTIIFSGGGVASGGAAPGADVGGNKDDPEPKVEEEEEEESDADLMGGLDLFG